MPKTHTKNVQNEHEINSWLKQMNLWIIIIMIEEDKGEGVKEITEDVSWDGGA